jgi:hypothetical protein
MVATLDVKVRFKGSRVQGCNTMENQNKRYHTVGTVPKVNR